MEARPGMGAPRSSARWPFLLRPDPELIATGVGEVQSPATRERIRRLEDAPTGLSDGLLRCLQVLREEQHEMNPIRVRFGSCQEPTNFGAVIDWGDDDGAFGTAVDKSPPERPSELRRSVSIHVTLHEYLVELGATGTRSDHMAAPLVYLSFPGTAREALNFYADVFGGDLSLHSYEEFGRTDGPPDAIAHGVLDGVVALAGSDAPEGAQTVRLEGLLLSLLGTAEPAVLHEWFEELSIGGSRIDPLAQRPWGASDGQVTDRHGLRWLIGYEPQA